MTNIHIKKVFIVSSVFTVVLALIQYFILKFNSDWLYKYQWYLLIYFYLITLLSLSMVEKAAIKSADNVSKGFFGAMMVRMFVSVIIALIIIYFDRESSTIFAINFVILYFLYLGLELYYLLKYLQPRLDSKETVGNDK